MSLVLGTVGIFVVLLILLLGLSIGTAFLIHWLLPAVSMDMALLVAIIAVALAIVFYVRLMATFHRETDPEQESESKVYLVDREFSLPRRQRKRR